jgi:NAD+ kinase
VTVGRVALVENERKPNAVSLAGAIKGFFSDHGIEVVSDDAELVVSLGGDGTMLRAAQWAHRDDIPLVGINLGTLGYLTEADAADWRPTLEAILDGRHQIEERMMLACELTPVDGERQSFVGLNEVLVERSSSHRLVRLLVNIGGESLAAFNADGVIVATPTGSTAYALSAGGPIVGPQAECLVVVPVSPHMIFSRPFVLASDVTVEIFVDGPGQEASLSLDGALGCDIRTGDHVKVVRHPRPLRLVRVGGPGFIDRLRTKLGLPA